MPPVREEPFVRGLSCVRLYACLLLEDQVLLLSAGASTKTARGCISPSHQPIGPLRMWLDGKEQHFNIAKEDEMQQAFDSQLRAIQMLADQVQAFPGSIAEDVTQHTVRLCGIGTGISEASGLSMSC